jgi:hypothetical protein
MSGREEDVNESLRALDEAHRLGRLSREDYRARRRRLLGPLLGGEGITARQAVMGPRQSPGGYRAMGGAEPVEVLPAMFAARPLLAGARLWIWAAAALACALLAYWLLAGE